MDANFIKELVYLILKWSLITILRMKSAIVKYSLKHIICYI